MKVVDVNPYFYPLKGGIEHRMHLIAKEMVSRGHEVTILTGRLKGTEPEETTADGYRVIRLPSRLINIYNPPYITSDGVLETLEDLDADIVNFNYRWAPSYSRDIGRYGGKKIFTFHNMWGEGVGMQRVLSEINDSIFRLSLDTFDHIISVSDHVRDDLVRRGIPPEMVTTAKPCLGLLPEPGAGEGDFILSLGRLVRTKGIDRLIEAMEEVDHKLIICGKGPEEQRLRKMIDKRGLEDRIELRGWVSEEEKARLMGSCKLFVMPSRYESYGLAALEAMSYGCPIVCTDVDGLPGTVCGGGLYVPPDDPQMLSRALNALLGDEAMRRKLGENSRAVAETQTVSKTVDILEEVYGKVAGIGHSGMY